MMKSMAEAGIKVNTTTKPTAFGRMWYSPAGPKPLVRVPVTGKRQIGPGGAQEKAVRLKGKARATVLKNGRKGRGCIGRKGKADSILARKNMRFDASTADYAQE